MGDFQSNFQQALRRRLFPQAPLHLKQIAGLIGRSENTVARWWRGETHISGEDLYRIADALAERGDKTFLAEVFDGLVAAEPAASRGEEKALALIRSLIRKMDHPEETPRVDVHSWVTAEGLIAADPSGQADYVRQALGLGHSTADLATYAMRVLGWIAVTESADGSVTLRHDGRRVAPSAAERICEWLDERADRISHVKRSVRMEQHWVETYHASAAAAADAVARIAFILRVKRRPWTVKQLPLDRVKDPLLQKLLKVYSTEPHRLVHAAAAMGAFTTSSLFGVRKDEVVSHHVATGFGFDTSLLVGVNVLSRADTDYALMLHARVQRASREGAIYTECAGTIDDRHVRYLNLSMPETGPLGQVLTSTVMLEHERVDA